MPIFYIEMKKDFTEIKKILSPLKFKTYSWVINKVVWNSAVRVLGGKLMAGYNPEISDDRAYFSEENPELTVLENDKRKLEGFLYGDISHFRDQEFYKKVMSNRILSSIYSKFQSFINNQFERNSILIFFNSMSITIVWGIKEA
jgi:hypothetical protein